MEKDFRSIPLTKDGANAERAVVDCRHADWRQDLHSHLYAGSEVDLINFDYELHRESCELIGQAFDREFKLDSVPGTKAAHFRKKLDWSKWTKPAEGVE
jgi:hypothetical protein